MRKHFVLWMAAVLVALGACLAQASGARSWTGTLVDAACYETTEGTACGVSNTTSNFGIVLKDGSFKKFDGSGNVLTLNELKNAGKSGKLTVTVTGALYDNTIQVRSVKIA